MSAIDEMAEALGTELSARLDTVDFDLAVAGDAIDIATDDWTLHLEEQLGWIAIDSEPDDAVGYPAAIHDAFQRSEIEAIGAANRAINGRIVVALLASGDPLSAAFAAIIGMG